MKCLICNRETHTETIPLCADCIRTNPETADKISRTLHKSVSGDRKCSLCENFCNFSVTGLCGLDRSLISPNRAMMTYYEDPLPTNCCNAWFCRGSSLRGTNLAVFYYGCNFDCLYCQNWEHKKAGRIISLDVAVEYAMKDRIKCICHFGGSPEPQLQFAIRFSRKVLKERDIMICWEWNGGGREKFVKEAVKISSESKGTVKFDLKAWNDNLYKILTGRSNKPTLKNFKLAYDIDPEVVSATTLLVPYYVDEKEVEGIASFIAEVDEDIPYSLLVFHPDYRLRDLPVTPREQVVRCYNAARRYLKNVNIGNLSLLGF
ncbi:Pyruvate-formate lyase-activating enzyme [Archaeoglobus sulfaticallidus PM70-1]|uniref:Pyruvate-formate lyase-activating enzyme n=1 Tax=Archaeoglobus sulfaticallidus PM70-1 TaxID=387631 RepID=N0BJY3_9EURY|nr:radical SAM protein [Archaeoglobus sulfaticallidus]AGK60811.1 Pyruvate-formate lyase-activating enzyme [Archaeoglobus sulfaticallidus PM70-1]